MAVNPDENNVSIIDCGGRTEINYLASILHHFGVDCSTVFDQDATTEISEAEMLLGADCVFQQSPRDLEGMLSLLLGTKWTKKKRHLLKPQDGSHLIQCQQCTQI